MAPLTCNLVAGSMTLFSSAASTVMGFHILPGVKPAPALFRKAFFLDNSW